MEKTDIFDNIQFGDMVLTRKKGPAVFLNKKISYNDFGEREVNYIFAVKFAGGDSLHSYPFKLNGFSKVHSDFDIIEKYTSRKSELNCKDKLEELAKDYIRSYKTNLLTPPYIELMNAFKEGYTKRIEEEKQ